MNPELIEEEMRRALFGAAESIAQGMRPAKSSTQPRNAKTWCALKFKWAPVLAF